MQQQMCYLGQEKVFEAASECFERLSGVEISAKQIERVCHHYGQVVEDELQKAITEGGKDKNAIHRAQCYVMLDGGMLLTREEKWKEMKLARLFNREDSVSISKNRGYIGNSLYIAHLGNHRTFLKKVEHHVDIMANVVFIADGAPWIWKWVESMYPESRQILDFYHARQHLCQYADLAMPDKVQKENWLSLQTLLLLNDGVEKVIDNILRIKHGSKKARSEKQKILEYYSTHKDRMKYQTYRESGLMIGSGPIEAAHKNVIQQRMKLSGQRWTMKGAQQMANLRALKKSNQWHKIVELTKIAA